MERFLLRILWGGMVVMCLRTNDSNMQVSLSADTNFQLYLKQQITSCFQPILSGFMKPVK